MPASSETHCLGIDLGTSGVKVLLIRRDGSVCAETTREYPISAPQPLWSEQNPLEWADATAAAIRAVLADAKITGDRIAAIGLSGQMHGLVLLDANGEPLRSAILWNDQRTAVECDEITRRVGSQRVLELTGNPILTGFTAPKLAWVRKHEPAVWSGIARVLLPKDYIRYRLSGEFATDVSDASGMSLLDVGRRMWSDEVCAALDVPRGWLATVYESHEISARTRGEFARAAGLPDGVPIVAGAGDQAAGAIGCGLVDEGPISVTIGTSGVVFAVSDAYRVEPNGRLHAFCHAAAGKWHLMGVMLSAGGSLRWYRDTLCAAQVAEATKQSRDAYELITDEAATVAPGCDGLTFLPYLTGERTPHADPLARGAFVGLSARHTHAHLSRSVLEGVTFGLRDSVELMRSAGVAIGELRVSGGGARSELWRQMIADVLGAPVFTAATERGAAYGAALLAAVGAGWSESVAAATRACVKMTPRETPGTETRAAYEQAYARFRDLYPILKPHFAAL
ncbi:MAG: xylulokinase [Phycisphaerae bacterium]